MKLNKYFQFLLFMLVGSVIIACEGGTSNGSSSASAYPAPASDSNPAPIYYFHITNYATESLYIHITNHNAYYVEGIKNIDTNQELSNGDVIPVPSGQTANLGTQTSNSSSSNPYSYQHIYLSPDPGSTNFTYGEIYFAMVNNPHPYAEMNYYVQSWPTSGELSNYVVHPTVQTSPGADTFNAYVGYCDKSNSDPCMSNPVLPVNTVNYYAHITNYAAEPLYIHITNDAAYMRGMENADTHQELNNGDVITVVPGQTANLKMSLQAAFYSDDQGGYDQFISTQAINLSPDPESTNFTYGKISFHMNNDASNSSSATALMNYYVGDWPLSNYVVSPQVVTSPGAATFDAYVGYCNVNNQDSCNKPVFPNNYVAIYHAHITNYAAEPLYVHITKTSNTSSAIQNIKNDDTKESLINGDVIEVLSGNTANLGMEVYPGGNDDLSAQYFYLSPESATSNYTYGQIDFHMYNEAAYNFPSTAQMNYYVKSWPVSDYYVSPQVVTSPGAATFDAYVGYCDNTPDGITPCQESVFR